MIRYDVSQQYRPHVDGYDTRTVHGQNNCRRGGNRLITTLLYLSDVEGGGCTAFAALGVEVAPVRRGPAEPPRRAPSGLVLSPCALLCAPTDQPGPTQPSCRHRAAWITPPNLR